MEFKSFASAVKEVSGRTVTGIVAVTGNMDLYNDIIHLGAFKKTIFENKRHFRHLWQHSYNDPPIAKIESLEEVGRNELPDDIQTEFPTATGGLKVARTYLETPRGNEILAGIVAGAVNEMSIGYDAIKYDFEEKKSDGILVRNLREVRLWDTSDVNWGANPATSAVKSVVPYKQTGKQKDGDWNLPDLSDFTSDEWANLSSAEKTRVKDHFAMAESLPVTSFEQLKFPHHLPTTEGIGAITWKSVSQAMAALMGGKDGVALNDEDRHAVYNHLVQHYKEFGEPAPEFEFVKMAGTIFTLPALEIQPVLFSYYGSKTEEVISLFNQLKKELSSAVPQVWVKPEPAHTDLVLAQLDILLKQVDIL